MSPVSTLGALPPPPAALTTLVPAVAPALEIVATAPTALPPSGGERRDRDDYRPRGRGSNYTPLGKRGRDFGGSRGDRGERSERPSKKKPPSKMQPKEKPVVQKATA